MEVDAVPLNVRGVVFGSTYFYMTYKIFMMRVNRYSFIKDVKSFIIVAYKGKSKIYLLSSNQAKKLINSSRKFSFLFLRQNKKNMNKKSKGISSGMY